ncbi:MAG TPA: hypothetical protein VN108_10295, partial [Marmoricola sp.]|nr:hypothetical protein [Marmoricola sp.]
MEDEPEPDEEKRFNPFLIIGLRIVLVALVAYVGILVVGNYFVGRADLKEVPGSTRVQGAVPVLPITGS